jgi:hypothetical protein
MAAIRIGGGHASRRCCLLAQIVSVRSFEDIRDSLQRLERIAIAHERRLDEVQD